MTAPALNLAAEIEREHQAAIGAARSAVELSRVALGHAAACGRLLLTAKGEAGHGAWEAWVETNCAFGPRQARKYMRIAENEAELISKSDLANSDLTIDQALAALASPKPEQSHTLRVMGSSESPEWYTPPRIVERVVATLGEIDLDPSWHPESPVQARATYTANDDGLAQRWAGRVFLNPPYGREIDAWVTKLVEEYSAGAVSEAIALLPARVDTEWFRRLDPFPRCFVWGRLTFANAENPAPFPSAVVYLGRNVARFLEVFGEMGSIFARFEDESAIKPGLAAALCRHIGDSTLLGLSPDPDGEAVEITSSGGDYVWVTTTLDNTQVVGMRRPVRACAVDQVLAVIGINPRALSWKFVPGTPPIGLQQMLVEAQP